MVINTNTSANTSAALLDTSSRMLSKSLARLSSGSKINSPEDDSAGLAVSMKMSAQIARTNAAKDNVGNAVSFNQTADGYLGKVNDALSRMSELAILAQDVTKTGADRTLYNAEFATLGAYVNSTATKQFNGVNLFDGVALSVTADGDTATFSNVGSNLGAAAYTTATASTITTAALAITALTNVKAAITQLSTDRSSIGANIQRLSFHSDELSSLSNNLSAAKSRITDVDVAYESTKYAKANILVQSGTAMLAQANSATNSVLKLLQ
jgi:flagellin